MEERLQKVLSRAGVASRRAAEQLMLEGRVLVNGRKATELGTKVDLARDEVRVDGVLIADISERVYYVLYKPSGCVTTLSDPEGRATIADWTRALSERVYPVGRLDYDAEGALILTNDGDLAHRLMHPKFGARRTYLAKVKGGVGPKVIEALRAGVKLEDGFAKPLEAELMQRADRNTWIRLVVDEGRTHLVKRLCEAVGHPVVRLFRASYAGIEVAGMMPGELRELSAREVKLLKGGGGKESAPVMPPRRDARRNTSRSEVVSRPRKAAPARAASSKPPSKPARRTAAPASGKPPAKPARRTGAPASGARRSGPRPARPKRR